MVIAIIIILIVGAVLAKLTSKPKFWRFFLINIGVMVLYNVIVWGTVIEFYDSGEAGALLIFWDVAATCIHLTLLFIVAIVTAIRTAVKKQN
jgi:hypothetical protein